MRTTLDCLAAMVMWPYVANGQCNDLEIVQVFFPLESSIKFNDICSKVCGFHFWPRMPDQPKPKENVNRVCVRAGPDRVRCDSFMGAESASPVVIESELPMLTQKQSPPNLKTRARRALTSTSRSFHSTEMMMMMKKKKQRKRAEFVRKGKQK